MRFLTKVRRFFVKQDGEKDVLNKKRAFLFLNLSVGIAICFILIFGSTEDSSVVIESMGPIEKEKREQSSSKKTTSKKVAGLLNSSKEKEDDEAQNAHSRGHGRYIKNIEYKAPQVIRRKGPDGFTKGLPLGSNLIGKLLTSIDTREVRRLYKVLLPYGGKDKNGGSIPKNTIIFGTVNYPGKGNKLFIQFSKALLPDGKEVKLNAQALSSKNYSPGILGDFHGRGTERIVSTLGLSMVSAMTDTLTEKQALGQGESIIAKATTKNALYQGVSRAAEIEAGRQAEELGKQQEYVTVQAGTEMIVNLISTYYGDQ